VADLLAAADVFALCSRTEGLPGTLIEAVALEVPVVATDIAPVLEVVGPDGPAALVAAGDAAGLAAAIVGRLERPPPPEVLVAGRAAMERSFAIAASAQGMVQFWGRSLGGPPLAS
jgi:glycosyltransferase involved in cell wall biosynthesis